MIKIPIAFLFTLSFSHLTSCNIKKTPAISTLHIDNLTYSSYRWRHSKADTGSELFIDNYLFINGDGKYLVMRHAAAFEPAQYFKGSIGDSMIDLIEKALNKKWDSTYFNLEPRIYDGNSYDLNYVTNGQQKNI